LALEIASGLRGSLVTSHVLRAELGAFTGPAVVVIGPDDRPRLLSPGAAELIAAFGGSSDQPSDRLAIPALLGLARRYAAGLTTVLPRVRIRDRNGRWLVLHAAPLSGAGGHEGDIAVTIEVAHPPDVLSLIVSAFRLTAREQDVLALIIQGADTKDVAFALHMSAYTVQDHLKSIFDKAGVRSRRELVAHIFLGQYAQRLGSHVGPSGWFAGQPTAT
jgi:DNA-binding CsgD family transcriptional regulator